MASDSPKRILLAGGGTGGHVYPLLAVVEALEVGGGSASADRRGGAPSIPAQSLGDSAASAPSGGRQGGGPPAEYHWLGSERSESRLVPQFASEYGIPIDFHQLDIRFSYRLPTPRNWGYYRRHILPLLGGRPFRQALAVLNELRPGLVLASGGYVAAPALWAAHRHGIPYALLQLDAAVGLVNAHFAPGASHVYASTPRAAQWLAGQMPAERVLLAGFPARRARRTRGEVFAHYGFDPARRLLVIMGGSLGTGAIAGLAAEMVRSLDKSAYADEIAVLFSAGERMDTAEEIRAQAAARLQFAAVDYIGDSVSVLAASDFYLGRSGASTVAELIATGPQCLLIPDPQHRDRQQFHNAEVLARRGQGEVVEQRSASSEAVLEWLARAWQRPRTTPPEPPAADVVAADLEQLLLNAYN